MPLNTDDFGLTLIDSQGQRKASYRLQELMVKIARQTNVTYHAWSQYLVAWGKKFDDWCCRGACRGWAFFFLATWRLTGQFVFFNIATARNLERGTDYNEMKSKRSWPARLPYEVGRIATIGESLTAKKSDEERQYQRYGLKVVATIKHRGSKKIAQQICRPGYFRISTPTHSMAAFSQGGFYVFFDPNCGFLSSNDPKAFAKAVTLFLNAAYGKRKTVTASIELFAPL